MIRLRNRLPGSLLLLSLTILCSCGSHSSGRETDRPIEQVQKDRMIRITDEIAVSGGTDTLRFGHLHTGEIAVMPVWVANESRQPVVLLDYERSCGCTSLEFDSQPILSGRARRIEVTFDSRGEWGWQLKQVDVQVAGMQRPLRLLVEADVE